MPIVGKKKLELTIESIYSFLTPFDIYRFYFGPFEINQVTKNHLRGEKSASFIIGNKYGELSHFDFGDQYWRGDPINLVQQIYNCDLNTALKIIDKDFNLGIISGNLSEEYKKITSKYEQPQVTKKNTLIQVTTRKFTKEELQWWNQYHQDIADLRENNIYSIKSLYLNKKRFVLKDTDLRFGYYYEPGYWKIYRPTLGKDDKWFPNNVPIHMLDGKDNIKNCKTAFINKSKKDMMVIKKIFPCSVGVQNEGIACFTKENVEYFKSNSERQILSFDSDVPGVKSSQQITKLFDFGYCNVPKKYLNEGIKDWAALGAKYSLKIVEDILKQKEII